MIGNYIKAVAVAVSRSTAKLMKTGQTTSYRTGDDGDLEAGRNTSFTVLAENNPFGNTNRFTDELGGQTYTKNIVIDWSTYDGSTVLGWRRTTSSSNWDNSVTNSLAVSIAPFTSGWRLPNIMELFSIFNFQSNNLNYSPFNININNSFWSSTTYSNGTTSAFILDCGSFATIRLGKTTSCFYIPCRTFTVTGTTLS
jgi:hypothetical protein